MRILVENGCYHLRNMGDVAMLQVAIERLTRHWPQAEIRVLTDNPQLLERYSPGAVAVKAQGRRAWFQNGIILGGLYRFIPSALRRPFCKIERILQRLRPEYALALICWREKLRGRQTAIFEDFIAEIRLADLLVVSGGGDLNDEFSGYALSLLDMLSVATYFKVPFALFGQGIGPLRQSVLRSAVRKSLPATQIIHVREALAAPALLQSLGVHSEKICVTGDDAIEMAFSARSQESGEAIGVNLRLASYSAVSSDRLDLLQDVLLTASRKFSARLLPMPISFHPTESDVITISKLLSTTTHTSDGGAELDSPQLLIEQVARCRIVVTGSYHAAVFALSQGIPVVCLAKSAYYISKFAGLADQFGGGCTLLIFDHSLTEEALLKAVETTWQTAETHRPLLLRAARHQTQIANNAYQALCDSVERRNAIEFAVSKEPDLNPAG